MATTAFSYLRSSDYLHDFYQQSWKAKALGPREVKFLFTHDHKDDKWQE
jgi:phosphoribosyl 1,2-cyclic phosphodiesterase